MSKIIFAVFGAALVCALFYRLGRSSCKIETLVREKEVIRYVERRKADIYSRPNASRAKLLELMRRNELYYCPRYPVAGAKVASELEQISAEKLSATWEWIGRVDKLRRELEICAQPKL